MTAYHFFSSPVGCCEQQCYEHSLAIREKSLGSDNPYVTTSLNNLAGLYKTQGRFDEAEPVYERSLAICKKKLGDKHPTIITVSQNLAELVTSSHQ